MRTPLVAAIVAMLLIVILPGGASASSGDLAAPEMVSEAECGVTGDTADEPGLLPPSADLQATLEWLYERYEGLPGFIDVYYWEDATPAFQPTFEEEVPPQAWDILTPIPVSLAVVPEIPEPAIASTTGPGTTPSVFDVTCTGIRPGAWISTPVGVCTLGFIFKSGSTTYASTAGHCISVGQTARIADGTVIGTAVFSANGGVGNDFALIEVKSSKLSLVSPEMCTIAGPTGSNAGSIFGDVLMQTGHGGGVVYAPPRAKAGVGGAWGANSFSFWGGSIQGDSGSAVRLDSGEAVGTETHIGVSTSGGVLNWGTTLPRGIQLAGNAGFGGLTLQTVSYTHP